MNDTSQPWFSRRPVLLRELRRVSLALGATGLLGAQVAAQVEEAAALAESPVWSRPQGTAGNAVLAGVGDRVVTELDLEREWAIRRWTKPDLLEKPSPGMAASVVRDIVRDLIWIERAREFPRYAEIATPERIQETGRTSFGALWEEELPEALRAVLRRQAEAQFAQRALLTSDPTLMRSLQTLPEDLRRYYNDHPQEFVEEEMFRLAQVLLPRAIYRDAEQLALRLREAGLEAGRSFESAAEELAPGSYQLLEAESFNSSDRRADLLEFVRTASAGAISPPFAGTSSVRIYQLAERRPGRTIPFEEVEQAIEDQLREQAFRSMSLRFFLFEVLPYADFFPIQLFDEELESLGLR